MIFFLSFFFFVGEKRYQSAIFRKINMTGSLGCTGKELSQGDYLGS